MNGLELAREIRRRQPALPVVLTAGYSQATQAMAPEEFGLLAKPYRLDGPMTALRLARRPRT